MKTLLDLEIALRLEVMLKSILIVSLKNSSPKNMSKIQNSKSILNKIQIMKLKKVKKASRMLWD